jgi:transcriptional regulator with GAF, ATPase, and Fis domain
MLKDLAAVLSMAAEVLSTTQHNNPSDGLDFYSEVQNFEVALIQRALRQTNGNQAKAARLLGLKQTTLHGKIKHYDIYPSFLMYGRDEVGEESLQSMQ